MCCPNAAARIVDGEGRLLEIHNTYTQISFNFGPTLLAWLDSRPDHLPADHRGRPPQPGQP